MNLRQPGRRFPDDALSVDALPRPGAQTDEIRSRLTRSPGSLSALRRYSCRDALPARKGRPHPEAYTCRRIDRWLRSEGELAPSRNGGGPTSTAPETRRALSYVQQIKEVFAELGKANTNKLQCAIKLGGLLNDAKEALGKKGNWMELRSHHFREISHSTANVYMQLATAYKELLDDPANSQHAVNFLVEKDLSIRGALEALKRDKTDPKELAKADALRKAEKAKRDAEKIAKAEAEAARAAASSGDLAAVLEDKAPDELLLAITDKEKKTELLKRQLRDLNPHHVFNLLAEVWASDDDFELLGRAIADRLKSRQAQAMKRRTDLGGRTQASVQAQLAVRRRTALATARTAPSSYGKDHFSVTRALQPLSRCSCLNSVPQMSQLERYWC